MKTTGVRDIPKFGLLVFWDTLMYNEGKRSQGARERLTHKTFTRLSILCFPASNFANGWWHGKLSVTDRFAVFDGIWPCWNLSGSFIVGHQIFASDGHWTGILIDYQCSWTQASLFLRLTVRIHTM